MSENVIPVPQTVENTELPPLDAPNPAFSAPLPVHDIVPSSTRTSFTRVDHDDEQQLRLRQLASHDPLPPQSAPPAPEDATNEHAVITSPSPLKLEPVIPSLPEQVVDELVPQTPQTYLTFLLVSGKRRTMSFEPETAIGRVKELVWNSWPADWQDDRPPAPSYLRVLYLGRMLQDDETLTKLKLPTYTPQQPTPSSPSPSSPGPLPTIVHLSVRPYAPPNEGDALKKKKRRNQDADGSASNEQTDQAEDAGCCRCIIC